MVWALIEVDVSKLSSRTRRVNITVPERVPAIVDKMAARELGTLLGSEARGVHWSVGSVVRSGSPGTAARGSKARHLK